MKIQGIDVIATPESSNVASFGYDAPTRRLLVMFKRGGGFYLDVPPEVFTRMKKASSKGAFVHRELKDKYAWDRLPE